MTTLNLPRLPWDRCPACGGEILWARSDHARRVALEIEADPEGDTLLRTTGIVRLIRPGTRPPPGTPIYRRHRTRCPAPTRFWRQEEPG